MMPFPGRTTVIQCLAFGGVLFLAIIFRPRRISLGVGEEALGDRDVIGIHFGGTHSSVAIGTNNGAHIVTGEKGRGAIPSYVAFRDGRPPLVGFEALSQAAKNPKNTIYDIRSLIGRDFSDPELVEDTKALLYDVVNVDNQPSVKVHVNGSDILYVPEDISAMVFGHLRGMAETYLNRTVQDAVVTVPPHFHEAQRLATEKAAAMAGLNVIRIVNASMAAGVVYGIDTLTDDQRPDGCKECHYIIYDVEATETDLTLVSVDIDGFGGDAFNDALLKHALPEFQNIHDIDISKDPEGLDRLRRELLMARGILLSKSSTTVEFVADGSSVPASIELTRSRVQDFNEELSKRVFTLLDEFLGSAVKEKSDVSGVLFTGSLEHFEKFRPKIRDYFNSQMPWLPLGIRPDTAIAYGAAIQGWRLSSDNDPDHGCSGLTMDVTALGLGVEASDGVFVTLIPRGTVIPTSKRLVLSVGTDDDQDKIVIKVLEGERARASKNRVLGTLELVGLPPKHGADVDVEVLFRIDANYALTVVARLGETGKEDRLVLEDVGRGRYTRDEIEEIVKDGSRYYEENRRLLGELSL